MTRPGRAVAAAALAVLLGAAATACAAPVSHASAGGAAATVGASAAAGAAPSVSASAPAPSFRSVRTYTSVAVPVRLRIPAIGVDSPLDRLGLAADGTIAAPVDWQRAGWFEGGPRPGQPGPAVLLGHVDSHSGPGVFYRLAGLRPGAAVIVERADHTSVTFRVAGRLQVAKSAFPVDLLYAPTLSPVLRLVTCGGAYDSTSGHYRDNIVVTALPQGAS